MKYPMDVLRALCGPAKILSHMNHDGVTPLQILICNGIDEKDLNEIIMMNVQNLRIGNRNYSIQEPMVMLVGNPRYFNILQDVINMDLSLIIDYSLLHECMRSEEIETWFILDLLVKNPQSIFWRNQHGLYTPLHTLIRTGRANMTTVQLFLEYDDSQVYRLDGFSRTPFQLTLYFSRGHGGMMQRRKTSTIGPEVLQLILGRYENAVFLVDDDENSPLHVAIHNSIDISVPKRILELNPVQNSLVNRDMLTPVHETMMSKYRNEDFLQELILMDPMIIYQESYRGGITPLHSAIEHGYSVSMIKFISSVNRNLIDMVCDMGNTPLHTLISTVKYGQRGHEKHLYSKFQRRRILEILIFLLDLNPYALFAKNQNQETPVQLAF